jgi:hypothetical protein
MTAGIYYYNLKNHSLNQYIQNESRSILKSASLNQPWVENAQLDLVISVNSSWISFQDNATLYHRIMMFQIGQIAQNIYLKCESYGLGTVVLGAFYDSDIKQVLELPNSFTPIYVIPIGLTPKFFDKPTIGQPQLTELARYTGLSSIIFFYCSLYLTLPVIKKRMRNKKKWAHYICGSVPLVLILFHYMVIHGHVRNLKDFLSFNSYLESFISFLLRFLIFPTTRYELGQLMAVLSMIFGTTVVITGSIVAFRLVDNLKPFRSTHKYAIFITLFLAFFHYVFNNTFFVMNTFLFLLFNIFMIDLYFIIRFFYEYIKISKKGITSQTYNFE